MAAASTPRVRFWCNHRHNGVDVAPLARLRCLVVLECCGERSFVFAPSISVPTLLRRLLTPLSGLKLSMRLCRACVLCARGQPPHLRIDDFEMPPPQDLDDLKQHALSIKGVCKHRDDQGRMPGGLRVHGCVHLVHLIACCNRHAWF